MPLDPTTMISKIEAAVKEDLTAYLMDCGGSTPRKAFDFSSETKGLTPKGSYLDILISTIVKEVVTEIVAELTTNAVVTVAGVTPGTGGAYGKIS